MTAITLAQRRYWVGASEVAALFGLSPHLTKFELWHQKAGNIPSQDLDGQERIEAGRHLEPAIAAWASHKWAWPIRNVEGYLPHPSLSGMGCSLDFETPEGEPVEIKNVDHYIFRGSCSEWLTEGDTVLDAPTHMLLQVQHQLACRPPAERGWLVVCVGGNRLLRMEILRHPGMVARIEREVDAFWRSLEEGREPEPNFEIDAAAIGLLYGGTGEEVVDLRDDERTRELCVKYHAAHEIERNAAKQKKAALAELKRCMGEARCALIADGFKVKAARVPGGSYERKPHWRFAVTQKES